MSQTQLAREVFVRNMTEGIFNWIESNLHNPLCADGVTAKWGYSKWYTQRQFKKYSGVALMTYIRLRKMTEAARLLNDPSLSVKDVYIRFGFDDASSFNRTFKRCFGAAPTAYRQAPQDYQDKLVEPLDVEVVIRNILAD
ncbi:hypothetical protein TUM12370_37210 [Salmonella enterica subsp. enterica serovar Choleraesuis]|nr:hypothetical protein TUM12370_37210 [Salmonella enterica subsp. enterica serovar Choleraesuis]